MSDKRKILVAITARPSYSRIRSALQALKDAPDVDLSIVCSGSALLDRYGRVVDLIREDGFSVVEELYTFVEGDELVNMALTTSNTVAHTASLIKRLEPDLVVTVADRYETIGTAIAAAYCNIPLLHVQGGELTGNIDEKVRHAITKLADLHVVATQQAAGRLYRMGENPAAVHVTGCPSIDLAREALLIGRDSVQQQVSKTAAGAPVDLSTGYVVILTHPETENHDEAFEQMRMVLEAASDLDRNILLFWPNVDAGSDGSSKAIRVFRERGRADRFTFVKNLEGHLFLALLRDADCLIGNSSVGIRESAFLGTPVINLGDRQRGRERAANVRDVPWDRDALHVAMREQIAHGPYEASHLYGDGHSGFAIAEVARGAIPMIGKRFYDA